MPMKANYEQTQTRQRHENKHQAYPAIHRNRRRLCHIKGHIGNPAGHRKSPRGYCRQYISDNRRLCRTCPFLRGIFRFHPLTIHPLILNQYDERSKTVEQQCRYYEVDNIFEYMVETYLNGNISVFRELYHELNKNARKDFTDFLLNEVEPTYWREILKQMI